MRRLLMVVMVSLMIVLSACGGGSATPSNSTEKGQQVAVKALPNGIEFRGGKEPIYGGYDIGFPVGWRPLGTAGGKLGIGPEEHGEFYIPVGVGETIGEYKGSLEDLPEVMKDILRKCLEGMLTRVERLDLSIESTEKLSVNGFDFIKVRGIINMDSRRITYDQNFNYVGYYTTVTNEGQNVYSWPTFIGVVDISEDQSDIDIAEQVLDTMVTTMELNDYVYTENRK